MDSGGEHAKAVEVRTDADVVDAGDFRYVVEVVDEGFEWGEWKGGLQVVIVEFAVDAEENGVGDRLATIDVRGGGRGVEDFALGERGEPGLVPVIVDERWVKVDHDDAVAGGYGAEHDVCQVAC